MGNAMVFNIERFATEDGPGIRTVVFLKGCALRCRWCANPESQSFTGEILFHANACVGCRRCMELCPQSCIEDIDGFGFITDSARCTLCNTCIEQCYVGARSVSGKEYTVGRLAEELLRDESYYRKSGGGITFSGGEPLLQHTFIRAFSENILKPRGITTLIETCGHIPRENLQCGAEVADILYYDFKHMDTKRHKALTGSSNELILENLRWLSKNYDGFLALRYPYIPGCNDRPEDIRRFFEFTASLDRVREVWFLPYHRLGLPKYQGLGRAYPMGDTEPLRIKDIAFLREEGKRYGLTVRV